MIATRRTPRWLVVLLPRPHPKNACTTWPCINHGIHYLSFQTCGQNYLFDDIPLRELISSQMISLNKGHRGSPGTVWIRLFKHLWWSPCFPSPRVGQTSLGLPLTQKNRTVMSVSPCRYAVKLDPRPWATILAQLLDLTPNFNPPVSPPSFYNSSENSWMNECAHSPKMKVKERRQVCWERLLSYGVDYHLPKEKFWILIYHTTWPQ
jgi:hypothetical protein